MADKSETAHRRRHVGLKSRERMPRNLVLSALLRAIRQKCRPQSCSFFPHQPYTVSAQSRVIAEAVRVRSHDHRNRACEPHRPSRHSTSGGGILCRHLGLPQRPRTTTTEEFIGLVNSMMRLPA